MIGILNEKPSQARNFAKALGGMQGTFEGEQYRIVPARGHLYGFIKEPSLQVDPSLSMKYKSWKTDQLPWNEKDIQWKYEEKDDAKAALSNIRNTLSGCDEIVIATDDDPTGEGELLAWEILDRLQIKAPKFTRMFFEDESEKSIQKAFKERKLLGTSLSCMYDDPDYKQALFRTKWDYLSMQWTRIGYNYSPRGQMPRFGRLKSAMIKIVGDQLDAIKNYVKKPYYQVRFKDENGVVYTYSDEKTFDRKEDVPVGDYHESRVTCDSKTMKSSPPPKFLDLASLGGRLAPKGVAASTVLKTYQNMYEAQVVSYPRTEDKFITREQFNDLLPVIDRIAKVLDIDPSILTHRTPRKTHVKTGMAHGANRPGPKVPENLADLDRKFGPGAALIYETLARNYLATICEDYKYEHQTGHVNDYPKFTGIANVPKSPGWKLIYSENDEKNKDDSDDKDDNESDKGIGTQAGPFVYEGVNKKPQQPTMKWLMKQLEKHDVGTGATRTSIYADVTNMKSKHPLMQEKRGKITMAPEGDTEYALLPGTHIGSLDLTEKVMKEMKEIYDGRSDGSGYLHDVQRMITEDLAVMAKNGENIDGSVSTPREKYEIKDGPFAGRTFNRIWGGHRFTDDEVQKLTAGEEIEVKDLVSSSGRKYGVRGKLAPGKYKEQDIFGFSILNFLENEGANDYVSITKGRYKDKKFKRVWRNHRFTDDECRDLAAGKEIIVDGLKSAKTPGRTYAVKGKLAIQDFTRPDGNKIKFLGFKQTAFANSSVMPQSLAGHVFTQEETEKLRAGQEIYITDLTSKKGTKYSANLSWGKKQNGEMGFTFRF
ncbi:MAG: DNA topoisomerase [Lachnospiraceae bacterium]|nr:DNA topoisomerase [Lachnospiraceae bacterium]MEE3461474.1 DNA topoisomerase [Lachnospiraceae bacterium]